MDSFKGRISSVESFGSADGPGVRFVVFMQGCNMRCKYCHNPETWSLCDGQEYSADELFEKAYRYRIYWGQNMSNGGITVSGGEPLLQIDFVTDFFRIAKENGVHTTLDTSGQPFNNDSNWLCKFDKLLNFTDLVILDLKEIDGFEHEKLTGFDNENILRMARYLSEKGIPMWIRHVLVPGVTDDEARLEKLCEFIQGLKTVERVENLPYHTLGISKWQKLGIEYPLDGICSPTKEDMDKANKILLKK